MDLTSDSKISARSGECRRSDHERYLSVRQMSRTLAGPLSAEDCTIQSMPDASPAKWHLAHTTWFFETFVLGPYAPRHRPAAPEYLALFNSYYRTLGVPPVRAQRGLLSRPSLYEVLDHRALVDDAVLELLGDGVVACAPLVELGLQHEQQHQELLLTDLKHAFAQSPLRPAYRARVIGADGALPPPPAFLEHGPALRWIGHDGQGFAF